MTEYVFVFGSNLAGRHGAGSAKHAYLNWGAELGVGRGPTGNAYAIPTKDENLRVRSLADIERDVYDFIRYAKLRYRNTQFYVVKIGCGLAGYKEEQIKPMFAKAPDNVELPPGWRSS